MSNDEQELLDENEPITRREFHKEGAHLRDEIDCLYKSIVTLGERIEDYKKENEELKGIVRQISNRVLD